MVAKGLKFCIQNLKDGGVSFARFTRSKGRSGHMAEVHFSDYGIVAGVRVAARYSRKDGYYPKEVRGQAETVFPAFAVVRTTAGYRVTIISPT